MAGSSEHSNEISGSVKGGNFGDQLNENYNLHHGSYRFMLLS